MADRSREEADAQAAGTVTLSSVPASLCRRCVRAVSRRVRDVPGIVSFEVDAARGLLKVHGRVAPQDLLASLRSAGFGADEVPAADD